MPLQVVKSRFLQAIPSHLWSHARTLVWAALGATAALALSLWLLESGEAPFLLTSIGGSTIFLFTMTQADAAQPRALFGGHLGGAFVGILCYQIFGDAQWVYVLSLVLTMVFMVVTRTIHPPAGANPLFMVHFHAGPAALILPVGLGVAALFVIAFSWSRLGPGTPYPRAWW